jgi:hypothetical protein
MSHSGVRDNDVTVDIGTRSVITEAGMAENVSGQTPAGGGPPGDSTGRSGEILIRVAVCAVSGMVVSLGWILAGTQDVYVKTISVVIGLAALAVISLIVGYTRLELAKVRRDFLASEARLLAEIQRPKNPSPSRNGKRSQPMRRGPHRRENEAQIPNDLRIFLQGRESAYRDGHDV